MLAIELEYSFVIPLVASNLTPTPTAEYAALQATHITVA